MKHIHPDSIVKSFQQEPSIPKQLNTNVIGGSWNDSIFMKCGQLLWNGDNRFEFDKKFWNNALSSWLDYTK